MHKFMAESYLICNLCTQVQEAVVEGDYYTFYNTFNQFPALGQLCSIAEICDYQKQVDDVIMDHQHVVDYVNAGFYTWKAGFSNKFKGISRYEAQKMMGTVVDPNWVVKSQKKSLSIAQKFPLEFNVADNWPMCKTVINHVRDQSNAGLCWAHGTTEAFNDRLCIKSEGEFDKLLSVSDTSGCCAAANCLSFGVNGGQVSTPWRWFTKQGVVSGGDYDENLLCYDYTMEKCNHHSEQSELPTCDKVEQVAPQCLSECPSNTLIQYSDDKNKALTHYKLEGIDTIKADLIQYGTVTAAFTVYEDFLSYQEGIYQHTYGESLGGHAVTIQGYGVEDGVDYWLCKNSWNSEWGMDGFFKIKIGDSGINDSVYAGLV